MVAAAFVCLPRVPEHLWFVSSEGLTLIWIAADEELLHTQEPTVALERQQEGTEAGSARFLLRGSESTRVGIASASPGNTV